MKFWSARLGVIVLAMAAGAASGQIPPAQPPAAAVAVAVAPAEPAATNDLEASKDLAERFSATGLQLARTTKYSALGLRQSAALLEAAVRLNPEEPRFLRMLAFWRTQTGDVDAAIAAWAKYRRLEPDDVVAQTALIDLYLTRLQANDAKIKYISGELLKNPKLDNTVKAHVAAEAVPLVDQRSRSEALAMLAQARQFYPLPEVTLLEWQMLPPNATPLQRLTALLNIARANPVNTEALGGIADLISANGITDKALIWYGALINANALDDTPTEESAILNSLTERYRNGEKTAANDQLDKILQRYPEDQHAWFLRLTTQKDEESAQMLAQARGVFSHRLADLCNRIQKAPAGGDITAAPPGSATAGQDLPEPNIPDTIDRVKKLDSRVQSVLVDTLAEQAWFEMYYNHQPAAALPAITALKQLFPADNIALRRLQGWYSLTSENEADARAMLTPQQDKDALSALGLYELEIKKNNIAAATVLGKKLLAFPQTGELAAVIYQAAKAHGIKTPAATSDAAAMKAELDKFPAELLDVIREPQRFYTVVGNPVIVGHALGDPMLATVSLENNSKFDITIGTSGMLRPAYAFSAELEGFDKQVFSGLLVDRIMGRIVLHPGESISQVVRIDQGDLTRGLYKLPAVDLPLQAAVSTNSPLNDAGGRPTAGGYLKVFPKQFVRNKNSLALAAARERVFAELAGGSSKAKILDLDLISVYYTQYVRSSATNVELAAAGEFLDAIDKTRSDPDTSVRAWANYSYALLTTGTQQSEEIVQMLQAPEWQNQLLGLAAAQKALPRNIAIEWAGKTAASSAADPMIKTYAAGVIEMLNQQPATTQPTTAPAKPKS